MLRSTTEEYYSGCGCTIVSTGQKIPVVVVFTESKQAPEEKAIRVTRGAPTVAESTWMLGDSAYATLNWHDPYNPRNADDPKDNEYRVEDRIKEHSEDVQLKQSTLNMTYNRQTGVEQTNESVKNCGLGRAFARGRVHTRAQMSLALCLRLIVAITNYGRGYDWEV